MFRITSLIRDDEHLLTLEGCLEGAWVRELDTCWRAAAHVPGRRICVDLRDVCHVDAAGYELMTAMYRAGARFVTKGCFMPELVREISEAAEADLTAAKAARS